MITIDITNEQNLIRLDVERLRAALSMVLEEAGVDQACLSVAVVDDPTMAKLHEQFLNHEGPTDVLSFALEQGPGGLEGEVVVSAETAERTAPLYGWPAEDELLLYAIHGTLHLVGYDDDAAGPRARMRRRERAVLQQFGIEGRYETRRS